MRYKKTKNDRLSRDILLELPTFINELLLLLGSGMVLQEALIVIAKNYEDAQMQENLFINDYCNLYKESKKTGRGMVQLLEHYGKKSHVKELSKVANVIADGEKKGINLWEELEGQSKTLWEERKKYAQERIRISETKMSFPLGLLLIALIIITAAPAMMQM